MPTNQPSRKPRLSMIDQVLEHMQKGAQRSIERLSDRDLKDLIIWLEARQMDKTIEIAAVEDMGEYMRLRGQIEFVVELNGEITNILLERQNARKQDAEEESE